MRLLSLAFLTLVLLAVSKAASAAAQPAVHHDIDLWLHPETGSVTVQSTLAVNDRDKLTIAFAEWLSVKDVEVDDGTARQIKGAPRLTVTFSKAGPNKLTVRLSGKIPAEAASRAGAGPDGAYLFGSSGWMPDSGDTTISYRLAVSVPASFRAVATGELTDETVSAESYAATFESALAFDRPSIFAGSYDIREERVGGVRLRTYFHEGLSDFTEQYLSNSADYLRGFEEEIGAYPFKDFFIVSAPLPVGLGFPNLTFIDRRIVPLPFMQGRSLAHEILHNWWGNGVQVDYRQGNWAEGLTTYMADYGLAAKAGPDRAREMRLGWLRDYAALPEEADAPVRTFVAKRHQASQIIGYNKAAYLFHMLKNEIGADTFSDAVKQFWSDHRLSIAGWQDLRVAFEKASGRDLGWFFAQWLDRTGAPTLSVADVRLETGSEGYVTEMSLMQTQPAYRLKVPVEVETERGTVREDILVTGPNTRVELRTEAKPLRVRVDPEFDLFRNLLPGESPPILRDVMLAENVSVNVLSDDDAFTRASQEIVARLAAPGTRPSMEDAGKDLPQGALMVFGTPDKLAEFVTEYQLDAPPAGSEDASATVWTSSREDGEPVLLISAVDSNALSPITRPLPHYGRQSYIVFSGRKAASRGVWEAEDGPLVIEIPKDPE